MTSFCDAQTVADVAALAGVPVLLQNPPHTALLAAQDQSDSGGADEVGVRAIELVE